MYQKEKQVKKLEIQEINRNLHPKNIQTIFKGIP